MAQNKIYNLLPMKKSDQDCPSFGLMWKREMLALYNINVNIVFCFILYTIFDKPIGIMVRVFTNGLGDWGSIPDRVIQKPKKVLDACLLNTAV